MADEGGVSGEEGDSFIYDDDGRTNDAEGILTIINTNARSLCLKINSLVDCFEELDAAIGIITETWMSDGRGLDEDIEKTWNWAQVWVLSAGIGPPTNRASLMGASPSFTRPTSVPSPGLRSKIHWTLKS